MDREQLAAFDRVVRDGSFTRAAISLGLGQPAVSARMMALEEEVGGALFTRGRRVTLTALGESFLPFARRALEVLGEGVEAARRAQVGQRGRVRLGSLSSLAGGLVGPALAAFVRAHPEVDCFVRSGDHERIVALLLDRVVDLGVVTWPCTEAPAAELQAILIFREPVPLVASPGHALAALGRARRAGPVGLVTEDELVRVGRPLFRLRWWKEHHPGLVSLAERAGPVVDLPMETARRLALEGAGVGFFTRTYVADDLERGALVELEVQGLPRIHRDSALVRRGRSDPLSPATASLVEGIRRRALASGLLGRAPDASARRGTRARATTGRTRP